MSAPSPQGRPATSWAGYTLELHAFDEVVAQIARRGPAVPMVMIVSHNDNDYTRPDDRVAQNLRRSLDAVVAASLAAGFAPVGATVAAVCGQVLATPALEPEWVIGRASIQAG